MELKDRQLDVKRLKPGEGLEDKFKTAAKQAQSALVGMVNAGGATLNERNGEYSIPNVTPLGNPDNRSAPQSRSHNRTLPDQSLPIVILPLDKSEHML